MDGDFAYFSRRAQEERIAAMKARHPTARRAHIDMAERYENLAAAISAQDVRMAAHAAG